MNGSAIQDYIDLIVQAWRELREIAQNDADSLDEWKIRYALRGVTREDRREMLERWRRRVKA